MSLDATYYFQVDRARAWYITYIEADVLPMIFYRNPLVLSELSVVRVSQLFGVLSWTVFVGLSATFIPLRRLCLCLVVIRQLVPRPRPQSSVHRFNSSKMFMRNLLRHIWINLLIRIINRNKRQLAWVHSCRSMYWIL